MRDQGQIFLFWRLLSYTVLCFNFLLKAGLPQHIFSGSNMRNSSTDFSSFNSSPLCLALLHNKPLSRIKLLLREKTPVNIRLNGYTPVFLAFTLKDYQAVAVLVRYGALLPQNRSIIAELCEAQDCPKFNRLTQAIMLNRSSSSFYNASSFNWEDLRRALRYAIAQNQLRNAINLLKLCRYFKHELKIYTKNKLFYLLDLLAERENTSSYKIIKLYLAIAISDPETLYNLFIALSNEGVLLHKDHNVFSIACHFQEITALRMLLSSGIKPSSNSSGETPLHVAVQENQVELTELLVSYGISPNTRTKLGNSALHYAAKYSSDLSIITLLLKAGAQANLKNTQGLTPLNLLFTQARDLTQRQRKIVRLLLYYSSSLDYATKPGWVINFFALRRKYTLEEIFPHPLEQAVIQDNKQKLQAHLAQQNQEILSSAERKVRKRGLMLAIGQKNKALTELLLTYGAWPFPALKLVNTLLFLSPSQELKEIKALVIKQIYTLKKHIRRVLYKCLPDELLLCIWDFIAPSTTPALALSSANFLFDFSTPAIIEKK